MFFLRRLLWRRNGIATVTPPPPPPGPAQLRRGWRRLWVPGTASVVIVVGHRPFTVTARSTHTSVVER